MEDNTILGTIKTMLGIDVESTVFDNELVVHINSAFMDLFQIISMDLVQLTSYTATWNEVFKGLESKCPSIQKFTYLKVRLGFDPPSSSFVIEELKRQLAEEEWRLSVQLDILHRKGGDRDGKHKKPKRRNNFVDQK